MSAPLIPLLPEADEILVWALAIAEAHDDGNLDAQEVLVGKLIESVRPLQERLLLNGIDRMLEASGG